jgi:hypothetical protein
MYFNHEIGEWRSIPPGTQLDVPEENWNEVKEDNEGGGDSLKKLKRGKLKRLGITGCHAFYSTFEYSRDNGIYQSGHTYPAFLWLHHHE